MSESGIDIFDSEVEQPTGVEPFRPKLKKTPRGDNSALDEYTRTEDVDLSKPWMKYHKFELVTEVAKVRQLVDRAIQVGHVALDLETQGLDNRIDFSEDGTPRTQHQIVGYCLGLEEEGYYIPVRHEKEASNDPDPNADSVEGVEAEIKRLCEAAQPILKNGSTDILGAKPKDFEVAPRVVIEFWHAKFDQEFLYPVTGIDLWNPFSFEDGMLMVYALCTEDEQGLKDNAKQRIPPKKDPETGEEHLYEMIEFKQLFDRKLKKAERRFDKLIPRAFGTGHNVVLYGCSDGICTNLLCKVLKPVFYEKKLLLSFYVLEKQVAQVVRVIERTRVLLNKGEIASLLEEADKELQECEERIRAQAVGVGFPADFNPSSSAQLADFLFGPMGIWKGKKPEKTGEGQYKTDEKTIEVYAKEVGALEAFSLVIKHRQINKVRGTYLKNLANNTDELDQLRLNFRQTGAATGRFTAPKGDPKHGYAGVPIQGIPARDDPKKPKVAHSLRRLFIARPGYVIVKADYASQELRIAASTSNEQKWKAEYKKEENTGVAADLHMLTAQAFFPGLTVDSPDYKIKRNSGKCVHVDTLLLTHRGLQSIGSLGNYGKPETFVDAPPGLTVDGKPVVSLFNGGIKELVHVVTRRGVVTCTEAHRFKLKTGDLVPAGALRPHTFLELFIADGTRPVEPHWRNLSSAGQFLARHHYYNGAPAQIAAIEGGMVSIESCPRDMPNEVLAIIPAGRKQCLDITMGTDDHLYRANCLLTHNTANFALIYGGGVGAVQRATGCDKVEGARLKKAFDDSVPGFSKWVKHQHALVKDDLGVSTAFGRFLAIPDANLSREEVIRRLRAKAEKKVGKIAADELKFAESDVAKEVKKGRAACERKATNYPIQGAGADILKISLVRLLREFQLRGWLRNGGDDSVRMIMTVHDEIVFEIREWRIAEALPVIIAIMEQPSKMVKWTVPLVVEAELGPSWAAKIKWSDILTGKVKRPAYLEGREINLHPGVIVLDQKAAPLTPSYGSAAMTPPVEPEVVPPAVDALAGAVPDTPAPVPVTLAPVSPAPVVATSPAVNGHSNGKPPNGASLGNGKAKRIVSIRLKTMFFDRGLVNLVARACMDGRLEALKEGPLSGEEINVEFLGGGAEGILLYAATEGHYRVREIELREVEAALRRLNLFHSSSLREAHG